MTILLAQAAGGRLWGSLSTRIRISKARRAQQGQEAPYSRTFEHNIQRGKSSTNGYTNERKEALEREGEDSSKRVTGLFPRVDGVFQRIRLSIRFRKDGFRLDCLDVEDRGRVAGIDSLLTIIPPRSLPLLPVELSKSRSGQTRSRPGNIVDSHSSRATSVTRALKGEDKREASRHRDNNRSLFTL
ncbi:hypothetical protein HN011_002498 [Eciton burchellii]|nr:hypothetical protein HN011_002498 [Eciton burchellii]